MLDERLDLEQLARLVRRDIVQMIAAGGAGHPGGSLSVVEILVTLYFGTMRVDPHRPDWPDRDRLVLSKGHASAALYSVLARRGYFPLEILETFDAIDSILQAHPDMTKTPGVDMSTGSLGQGLSVAVGMALGARLLGKDFHVYVVLGDGEIDEGQVWEAAAAAAKYRLEKLTAFLDYNGLQLAGPVDEVMPMAPLAEKWRAFGWYVTEADGHSFRSLQEALARTRDVRGKPQIIIARTVKGKGVSFMENQVLWHSRGLSSDELQRALAELECSPATIGYRCD